MAVKGFGYIKYLDNNENDVTRKVFSSNTNVHLGAQVVLKKVNLSMTGQTGLPQVTVDNLDTYSVAAFAVGGDDTATNTDDTSLHKMYVLRSHDDSDVNSDTSSAQ
jgi:hypothetical protein